MSRSSRKNHRTSPVGVTPKKTHRKLEKLRDGLPIARRSRHYDERRQFDPPLPPSKLELPDDFTRDFAETYTRIDGAPARVRQGLPPNRNRAMRESTLQEQVHSYFQESPGLVSECVRRKERRRVLFALQRTRKGSGRGKRHHWDELSKVRCV